MNILITGGNGFIASNLYELLKDEYTVFNPGHSELDVLDLEKLRNFINRFNIDIVIHTAMVGGIRVRVDGPEVCYENLLMMENIIACTRRCKLVINLGSGAEFDRRFDIDNMPEYAIYSRTPVDYYGLSKNIIAKRIIDIYNIVNLRIFNCFGPKEKPSKFITNVLSDRPLTIPKDHYMDFFYIKDLYLLVIHCINSNRPDFKDINCVYDIKYKLTDIANMFNKSYTITNNESGKAYTGRADKLKSLNLSLMGLEEGLKEFNGIIKSV
jgi:GDP-L-fucose synthase